MGAKYELVKDEKDSIVVRGCELYRIRALKDFSNVKKGDLGGYVSSLYNLDQAGDCWIYDDAKVFQNAKVYGNAIVCDSAEVSGNALVYDNAIIGGFARVYEHARVMGTSLVINNVQIFKNSKVVDVAMYDNYIASGGDYNEYPVFSDIFCVTSPEVVEKVKIGSWKIWRIIDNSSEWTMDKWGWLHKSGDPSYEGISYIVLFDDLIKFCLNLKEVINEYLLVYKNRDDVRKKFISNATTMPAEDFASQYLREMCIALTIKNVDIKSEECILELDKKIEELKIKKREIQKKLEKPKRKNDKSNKMKTQKEKNNNPKKSKIEKTDKHEEVKGQKKAVNQNENSGVSGIFKGFVAHVANKRKTQ